MKPHDAFAALIAFSPSENLPGPQTPEGKYLALRLLEICGVGGAYGGLAMHRDQVLLSPALGKRAEQDLVSCGWIQARRFQPGLGPPPDKPQIEHEQAIKHVLKSNQHGFGFALLERRDRSLTARNRLLLAVLLSAADSFGYASLGSAELIKRTAFSKNQLKVQIQKLKDLGWLHGLIPGFSGKQPFRIVKTGYFLNLLHPDIWGFDPELKAVLLPPHPAWLGSAAQALSMNFDALELSSQSEVAAYLDHEVSNVASHILTKDWPDISLDQEECARQLGKVFNRRMLSRRALETSLMDLIGYTMAEYAYQRAYLIQRDLISCVGTDEVPTASSIRALPQFSAAQQGVVVLCRGFVDLPTILDGSSGLPLSFDSRTRKRLIQAGLLSDPYDAPLKYRSSLFAHLDLA